MKRKAKQYRINHGWTQSQMAVFCRVSRQTIARVEAGTRISDRLTGKIQQAIKNGVAL